MQSARSIELKVGILILAAVGLLAGFILIMGGVNFQPTYSIFVDFDNPGGLTSGAPVKIAGVKVGKIAEIQFRGGTDAAGKREALVRLKLQIERRYEKAIHENSLFYVTNQSVLGEQFLAIEPGSSDRPVLAEGADVRGLDPPRLDMLIAEMYELLHGTVSGIRDHKAEIGEAFESARKTLKGTGELMEQNKAHFDKIAENLEKITVEAQDLVRGAKTKLIDNPQIDRILTNADHVAADAAQNVPPMLADGRAAIADARRVAEVLGDAKGQAKLRQLLDDLSVVTSQAKGLTSDASEIVSHIKRGKGTVGAVVMDEQLYDDLQELVRDLKHNPWKFLWRE